PRSGWCRPRAPPAQSTGEATYSRPPDEAMEGGKLSMTLAKVLNVPKRFANQDDDRVLDEDAIVVVGATTKVFDKGGHGAPRPSWLTPTTSASRASSCPRRSARPDEEDQPVTTIRAKRITILIYRPRAPGAARCGAAAVSGLHDRARRRRRLVEPVAVRHGRAAPQGLRARPRAPSRRHPCRPAAAGRLGAVRARAGRGVRRRPPRGARGAQAPGAGGPRADQPGRGDARARLARQRRPRGAARPARGLARDAAAGAHAGGARDAGDDRRRRGAPVRPARDPR